MTFQRSVTPGVSEGFLNSPKPIPLCVWIGDTLAILSIFSLIPLGMGMLSVWLDMG